MLHCFVHQLFNYSDGPKDSCHCDTHVGSPPYELPEKISLLVDGEGVIEVQPERQLALEHRRGLCNIYNPTILYEVIVMNKLH